MQTKTKYGIMGFVAFVAIFSMSVITVGLSQNVVAAPANKAMFTAQNVTVVPNVNDNWATIIEGTIKTSSPSDLFISHQQECAIHTGLNLDSDNEMATSAVREDIRVLVDGNVVPISYTGNDANGEVTLCSRAYHIETNVLSTLASLCQAVVDGGITYTCPENIYFKSYIATKEAHGWTFVALDVGAGDHTVEVQAKLYDNLTVNGKTSTNTSGSTTHTVLEVGRANLIVTEEKLATGTSYPGQ